MTDFENIHARQSAQCAAPPAGPPESESPDPSGPPPPVPEGSFKDAKKKWINYFEENYLKELLQKHKGRLGRAARAAGMDRKTLYRLMRKHDIAAQED